MPGLLRFIFIYMYVDTQKVGKRPEFPGPCYRSQCGCLGTEQEQEVLLILAAGLSLQPLYANNFIFHMSVSSFVNCNLAAILLTLMNRMA